MDNLDDNKPFETIGKININIYKNLIDTELLSDEVVLTKKQLKHVDIRRFGVMDKYHAYLLSIINDPDYIFEDKEKFTVNAVKKVEMDSNKHAYVVIRLVVEGDNINYKNSIITMWDINDKKLAQFHRNKNLLYKKE